MTGTSLKSPMSGTSDLDRLVDAAGGAVARRAARRGGGRLLDVVLGRGAGGALGLERQDHAALATRSPSLS